MSEVQIAIIDQEDTQITLAVPGVQGPVGNAIPSGGTTNQVLFKSSATNYDATWGNVTSAMITDLAIVDADVSASAAIVDTKLATIATALKVSNSATTAASANTASAIVARDASGNFTAGTITAALTGAASSNVLKAGDTMTGALVVPLASASTPSLTFTGDLNTGIYSPGADQLAVATNGTGRLFINSTGLVGVGTNSPASLLSVVKAAEGTSLEALRLVNESPNQRSTSSVYIGMYGSNEAYERARILCGNPTDFDGNNGFLSFWTRNTGTLAEKVRITSAGLVGIGTTSPGDKLDVATGIRVNSGGTVTSGFANGINIGTWDVLGYDANDVVLGGYRTSQYTGLRFYTAGTERARINSSGRLLVGTSTDTLNINNTDKQAIVLTGNDTYGGLAITGYNGTSNPTLRGPRLTLQRSRGTTDGSMTKVALDDLIGQISFRGADGTDFEVAATIEAYADGEFNTSSDATDSPGRLVFSTTADGASSPTERMRIDSRGAVRTGNNTLYTGTTGAVTASTGTTVFTFDFFGTSTRHMALVKLSVMHFVTTNSIAAQPAAEYIFAVEGYTTGASAATTPTAAFQNVYVAATHFAFADTGNTSFTITLTNPSASAASAVYYKVEVLDNASALNLSSVTTT